VSRRKETSYISENPLLIGGVIAGSLLGVGAALLLTTKKGQEIQDNLCCMYNDASDKMEDISDRIVEKSSQYTNALTGKFQKKRSQNHLNLAIGGIAGGVLGIIAAMTLTGDSLDDLRSHVVTTFEDLSEKASDFTEDVSEKAEDLAETLQGQINYWSSLANQVICAVKGEGSCKSSKANGKPNLGQFVDWATLGVRLFQSIRK